MAFFQPNYCKIYHRRVRLLFGVEETVCITNLLFPHSFVLLLSIVLRQLCLSTPQLKPRVHSSLHVLGMFIYAFICHQSSCHTLYMLSINYIPSIVNEALMADINSCQEILSFIIIQ